MMGWVTVSVDWANAFIQAVLKEPMYMETPRGFRNQFYSVHGCLSVTKSIYGSKFTPRNWYTHLRSALLQLGLKESPNLLLLPYVDDTGIAAPKQSLIDDFVQDLRDLNFDLEIEDGFSSYLGIGIETVGDGARHMTQEGLIKNVVKPPVLKIATQTRLPLLKPLSAHNCVCHHVLIVTLFPSTKSTHTSTIPSLQVSNQLLDIPTTFLNIYY